MSPEDYVPIHIHSSYSILDGYSSIPSLIKEAARLELPAISLTDHGSLSGVYEFYRECRSAGIKPILGLEAYVAPSSRTLREPVRWGVDEQRTDDVSGGGKYSHLTVLATSSEGLHNLFRLHTDSYERGFYGKPRTDFEALSAHNRGLIVTTGCVGGPVATRIRLGQLTEAEQTVNDLKDIFGDRLYAEVMRHGISIEEEVEPHLLDISKKSRVPIVATLDSHYATESDSSSHDALLCVQTKALLSTPKSERFAFDGDGYHLLSREEVSRKFSDLLSGGALRNTLEIAERVSEYDSVFDQSAKLPTFTGTVDGDNLEIRSRCAAFLDSEGSPEARVRLDYELDTICGRGFAGYILVTAHILSVGRSRGIRIGPGRGSSGGSLVCYALGITEIDPLSNGLLFERFINPERVSFPDIDFDVDQRRRDELVGIASELYGNESVCQISTFGTIGAKSAIRDSVRILELPFKVGNELTAKLPPPKFGRQPTLLELPPQVGYPEVISVATGLEGATRSEGVHAAGIIISPDSLVGRIPLRNKAGKGGFISAYGMEDLEKLGYVKTDYLGLANLGVIDECVRLLSVRSRTTPGGSVVRELETELPTTFDDPATFELLSAGETTGVFQLDGLGMRNLLRRLLPTSFLDIASVLALYRPGPMGANAHTEYADRKNGRSNIKFPHAEYESSLAETLLPTYGLIVFQEQVLEILKITGGYTYGTAALIFDSMRKKDTQKMLSQRPEFVERLSRNNYSSEAIDVLWDTLVPFSDYSFNKSHSVGYATIAYWTAYLKRNHTREYFTALLSVESDPEKLHEYINEAVRWGIEVLPPDVNSSDLSWTITEGGIRFGLLGIHGVAAGSAAALVKSRPYVSLEDFFHRADRKVLNLAVLSALIESGAFDSLEPDREGFLASAEALSARAISDRQLATKGQRRLFSEYTVQGGKLTVRVRQQHEKNRLGLSLTVGRVTLASERYLDENELRYLRSTLEQHQGRARVQITFKGLTTYRMSAKISVTDGLRYSLKALGLQIREEE